MRSTQSETSRTENVVEWTTLGDLGTRGGGRLAAMLAVLIAVVVMALTGMVPPAHADDATQQDTSGGAVTVTDNITDTENLLGSSLGKVSDALKSTKDETGVTVKLLFIPKFAEGEQPKTWAANVLKSTDPKPNTVLLAVASEDGNLVVAVSANSDEWLRKQKTVDSLSEAAFTPLTKGDTPDWPGSAIALTDQVKTLSKTSTSSSMSGVGVIVFVAVLAVLVIAAIVFAIRHKRGHSKAKSHADRQLARRERRRSGRKPSSSAASSSSASGTDGTDADDIKTDTADTKAGPTEATGDIQETSSTGGHA